MASLITGSARLILAIAESIAVKNGYIAYMDTDSIFVSPNKVKEIQDFFRPLNPYSVDTEMFKIEEDDNHNPLDHVIFYGISAKRYCLYKNDNRNIEILKYSTHGLGHLKDIDGMQIWKSILTKDFKGYDHKIAVSLTRNTFREQLRFHVKNSCKLPHLLRHLCHHDPVTDISEVYL